jgi:glutaredoxin
MAYNEAVRLAVLLGFAVATAFAGGCRKTTLPVEPPAPARAELPEVGKEALEGGKLVLTYAREDGSFREASKIADIPEGSRKVVRVVDPTRARADRSDTTRVFVADLTAPKSDGHYPVRLSPRDVFETLALAQLGPGQTSPLSGPLPSGGAPAQPGADQGIIIYGTSWCGACAQARGYLHRRGVAFADKDIERDRAAAAELAGKCARAGIQPGGVPVIDVHGTLLQGFDERRLAALLAPGTQL